MDAVDSFTKQGATATAATDSTRIGAHIALLLMTVIWAVNFSVTKIALTELTPLAFNAFRFVLATVVMYLVLRSRGPVPLPDRGDIPAIAALGIVGNGVYQLFFILGVNRTGAGAASLLLAGTPLVTALLSAGLGHERIRPRVWFGVVCTLIGIVLVTGFGEATSSSPVTLEGNLLMMGATLSWAGYTVGSRRYVDRYGPVPVTAWTLWVGTPVLFLLGVPDLFRINTGDVTLGTWLGVAYGGVLSIAIAYLIWYYGVKLLGNTRTSVYSNLTPVLALVVAWILLREVPSLAQMAGAAVIVSGVTLAQRRG